MIEGTSRPTNLLQQPSDAVGIVRGLALLKHPLLRAVRGRVDIAKV